MIWRGRRETREIYRLVRLNDRIQLQVGGRCYFSRIEDIRDDEIRVAAPIEHGEPLRLQGRKVVVNLLTESGVHRFSCRVTGVSMDRVVLFSLSEFRDWGVIQQRSCVRIQDVVLVRLRRVLDDCRVGEWRSGLTQDIGRGGASVTLHHAKAPAVDELVELEFLLPDERALRVTAKVVRVVPSLEVRSDVELALQFKDVGAQVAFRIASYIRRRRSERESSGASFVRCIEEIPITFQIIGNDVDESRSGSIYDLSAAGLRMTVSDPELLRSGVKLDASVALGVIGTVLVECEVAWIRPGAEGRIGYQVGARFTRFHGFAEGTIHKYLSATRNSQGASEAA